MAVYTKLSKGHVENILSKYDGGALKFFEGILQGVENTNYIVETDKNKFILTIFEQRTNKDDLPFFFDYMAHLHEYRIYCPFVMSDKNGERIQDIEGKAAALFSFLDGNNIKAEDITPAMCFETGLLLARMHLAALDFKQARQNSMSLKAWQNLFEKIKHKTAMANLIQLEIERAEKTLNCNLPKAVVHADLFPDNIFMRKGHIEGVIDFYFSATDFLVYDLAIAVNSWCFRNGIFDRERFDTLIKGYESVRTLLFDEKKYFSDFARAAALRILMTREHDLLFHDPQNLVTPKDPLEYKRILEFHAGQNCFS